MISSMLQYIQKSPDCFHAVENLRQRLMGEGYTQLTAGEWSLTPGGKYFITKNGSSLLAFRVPQGAPTGFVLTASHSDSPCFRLRDHAELAGEFVRLSAERYGGMINDCWLDRPLSAAGRVLVRRDNGLETRLVDLKKDMALIPRVAIHLNRDGNNGTKYNPAQDLVALYAGGEQKGCFDREVAAAAGCQPEDIVARDLFLYNNQPGTVWGPAGEFLSAPRLDDLACVFACTQGFLAARETTAIPVLCVFDNEEIGSETKQGAASAFLPETLQAIVDALGLTDGDYRRLVANSFLCCMFAGDMDGMTSSARWLDYVPFTAVLVTPSRVLLGQTSLMGGLVSLVLVVACAGLLTALAGRVYRLMSLYKGNPPSLRRVLRMLREK